jgi:hypothetical protein
VRSTHPVEVHLTLKATQDATHHLHHEVHDLLHHLPQPRAHRVLIVNISSWMRSDAFRTRTAVQCQTNVVALDQDSTEGVKIGVSGDGPLFGPTP